MENHAFDAAIREAKKQHARKEGRQAERGLRAEQQRREWEDAARQFPDLAAGSQSIRRERLAAGTIDEEPHDVWFLMQTNYRGGRWLSTVRDNAWQELLLLTDGRTFLRVTMRDGSRQYVACPVPRERDVPLDELDFKSHMEELAARMVSLRLV